MTYQPVTATFKWRTVSGVVREKLGRDEVPVWITRKRIAEHLYPNREIKDLMAVEWNGVVDFTNMLYQTVSIEGFVEIPPPDAPFEKVLEFYNAVMDMPASFQKSWVDAIDNLNSSENDFLAPSNANKPEVTSNNASDAG